MISSFEDLILLLEQDNIPHSTDVEQQRVDIPIKLDTFEGDLMILWDARSPLVQFILPLPFQVPDTSVSVAESAIARLNHALMLPGFGLDHTHGFLYYRLSFPRRPDGTLSSEEVEYLFQTTVNTARDFYDPLLGVVLEGNSPEKVIADAKHLS